MPDDIASSPSRPNSGTVAPRPQRPGRPPPLAAPRDRGALRALAESALSRAAGGPVTTGNGVRVLRNASENYPAWLAAIAAARDRVLFENYLFADDATGRSFARALMDAARRGVRVLLLRDWLGCLGVAGRALWRELAAAGVEVRVFNPPRVDLPLGWLTRDHRKSIVVDGEVAFVSGLCVSDRWVGDPQRGRPEWRDTGVELRGPAVADVEEAFAAAWAASGGRLRDRALAQPASDGPAPGSVAVRVVATAPSEAGIFRLDLLIAAVARQTLWLTDAYFVAYSPYVEALRAASRDGVDVRLLVPGESDLPLLSPLSRAGYRPLLEAGVRVYEWGGPMLHAKTAVADGHWARVGSSNLNLASWMGNYELDVTLEDDSVAGELERSFREDLETSTEVVLRARRPTPVRGARRRGPPSGSAAPAAAGALRVGRAVGAALTAQRKLGPAEAQPTALAGVAMLAFASVAALWPRVFAFPLAALALWLGASLLLRAWRLTGTRRARTLARGRHRRRRRRAERRAGRKARTVQRTTREPGPKET